jgi:hypothetical protein
MQKQLLTLILSCFLGGYSFLFAQKNEVFTRNFEPVRKELTAWDPVRGEWLANSMVAMATNQPIPDRNFPEDFTPAEMYRVVPEGTRSKVKTAVQSGSNQSDSTSRTNWNHVSNFVSRPTCRPVMGRTYGDPHLQSFDGASYSFQTVGEFTLVKSGSGNLNIQVRQRNQGNDFSLNSAVAMNVSGDRVCLYASDRPDGNSTTPLRIGGEAVYVTDHPYFLDHGGVIRRSGDDYIVTWPSGENIKIDMRGTGPNAFMNLAVEVFPCSDTYVGILGNANGRSNDDFDIGGPGGRSANMNLGVFGSSDPASQAMEKEYLAFLSKDFARSWRIEQPESLFDYGFGQSTAYFTDERFPMVHHTTGDLTQNQRDRSRRECERQGLSGAALNACIYDNGFMNIPPTPTPSIPDHTTGVVITPVTRPVPNVNPGGRRPVITENPGTKNPGSPNGTAQPIGTKPLDTPPTGDPVIKNPDKPVAAPAPKDPDIQKPVRPVSPPAPKEPASSPAPQPVEPRPRPVIHVEPRNNGNNGGSSGGSAPHPAPPVRTPAPPVRTSTPSPSPSPAPAGVHKIGRP